MDEMIEMASLTFEDFRKENGLTYWWSSDFMQMLGYKELKTFRKAIERAIKACMTLNIPFNDHFIPIEPALLAILPQ